MTTPNDDFIGRYRQRKPISSRISVEKGEFLSSMGRQRDNLVGEAKPIPDFVPACRPQRIKNRKDISNITSDEVEEFTSRED